MIPKKIHFCWFGKNEYPSVVKKCIESWNKYLPEFEVFLWNEDNFNLSLYPYAESAYKEKKYAFVSDVCRLYVLREHGGIYLDSDVEILKPLDEFLHHKAFSGFEDNCCIPTGIIASEKNGKWVSDMLEYYEGRSFYLPDGSLDLRTNVSIMTELLTGKIQFNNSLQDVFEYVTFYPSDYFCPKSHSTRKIILSENTVCIHHFAGSWLPSKFKKRARRKEFKLKIINKLKTFFKI